MEIKAILTNYKGEKTDISNLIGDITLSGSSKECARSLEFSLLRGDFDKNLPNTSINLGDTIELSELINNKLVQFFKGVVWEKTFGDNTEKIEIYAYDKSIYLNKNESKKQVFTNKKPDEIVKEICEEFGLKVGDCASAKAESINGRDTKAYDLIMQSYTKASRTNGKKYKLIANGDYIEVFESGEKCKTILKYLDYSGEGKILSLNYKESLDDLINEVTTIEESENDDKKTKNSKQISKEKYGSMQKVIRGAQADVKGLMKDLKKEIDVQCFGSWEMITGKTIEINTPIISGEFYINSDNHTLNDGVHQVDLTLSNEFEMDEKDESSSESEESSSSSTTASSGTGWARIAKSALRHTGETYSQPLRMEDGYSDCSSFVYKVTMETLGKNWKGTWAPSTYTMAQRTDLWHEIPLSEAQPGDILWRSGHTSFLGANGKDYGAHMPGKPSGEGWTYNPNSWSKAFRIN